MPQITVNIVHVQCNPNCSPTHACYACMFCFVQSKWWLCPEGVRFSKKKTYLQPWSTCISIIRIIVALICHANVTSCFEWLLLCTCFVLWYHPQLPSANTATLQLAFLYHVLMVNSKTKCAWCVQFWLTLFLCRCYIHLCLVRLETGCCSQVHIST